MKKYTLGILDEEEHEIEVIQACFEDYFNISRIPVIMSIDELIDIIKQDKIDVISIDYKLRDHNTSIPYNGDYFFSELMERFGDFPAFVLTQNVSNARSESKKINPRFIVDKTDIHSFVAGQNPEERQKFVDDLIYEIEVHRNRIETDLKEVEALQLQLDKGEVLDGEDQNRYIELNNKLAKSVTGYNPIPITFFSRETNDRLDNLISKTEELLNKINKSND